MAGHQDLHAATLCYACEAHTICVFEPVVNRPNMHPGDQWSPTPKYVLRRACIRRLARGFEPGRFVEVGAGSGGLTTDFLNGGFEGVCYDLGESTRTALRQRLAAYGPRAQVTDRLAGLSPDTFDYLLAFEVLEHIEDDFGALSAWTALLKPGGACLVSVPAHQRKFGPDDTAVGHVRRYERAQLAALLARCGYVDIRICNYGFPLGNLTRHAANLMRRIEGPEQGGDAVARSIRSGVHQPAMTRALSIAFNGVVLAPFVALQRLFFSLDWGDGYVATARKPVS
jgi:SAM-dependent methyltransferase